jgi:hypothetical protein
LRSYRSKNVVGLNPGHATTDTDIRFSALLDRWDAMSTLRRRQNLGSSLNR